MARLGFVLVWLCCGSLLKCSGQMSPTKEKTVPQWIALLSDPDPKIRGIAAGELGDQSKKAADAVKPLVRCLNDQDSDVRFYAAWALGHIAAHPEISAPALLKAMDDKEHDVFMQASASLNAFPEYSAFIIPRWIAWLKGRDKTRRYHALQNIGGFDYAGRAAVPDLAAACSDEDFMHRLLAVSALGQIGVYTPVVEVTLRALLQKDDHTMIRQACAEALGKIGKPTPVVMTALASEFVSERLYDKDSGIALSSAIAFSRLWHQAAPKWKNWTESQREMVNKQREFAKAVLKQNRSYNGRPCRADAAFAALER